MYMISTSTTPQEQTTSEYFGALKLLKKHTFFRSYITTTYQYCYIVIPANNIYVVNVVANLKSLWQRNVGIYRRFFCRSYK